MKNRIQALVTMGFVFVGGPLLYGQTLFIGSGTANSSAVFHVQHPSKGFLLPSVDGTAGLSPGTGSNGMVLFDKDVQLIKVYSEPKDKWSDLTYSETGMIALWSGSIASIPDGWTLCNGSNGSPDLRGMFIVGYDASAAEYNTIGNSGGAHSVQLGENEMPSHAHSVTDPTHSHSVTASHSHTYLGYEMVKETTYSNVGGGGTGGASDVGATSINASTETPSPTMEVSSATAVNSVGTTGGGGAHENRPPYYVLAFIMKL